MLKHPKKDALGQELNYGDTVIVLNTYNSSVSIEVGKVAGSTEHRIKVAVLSYSWNNKLTISARNSERIILSDESTFVNDKWKINLDLLKTMWSDEGFSSFIDE